MGPAGTNISIERDVFPALVGRGLFGYLADGYWLDIGTPERYLQATVDILDGRVDTEVGRALRDDRTSTGMRLSGEGRILAPAVAGAGCAVEAGATVRGRSVLGAEVTVGEDAEVHESVLLDGVTVGARTTVTAAIIGPGVEIGADCEIEGDVVIGAGAKIGPGNVVRAGTRIFPGVRVPDGAINS
jgi:mannose-1-phosphate guanylyltransferase